MGIQRLRLASPPAQRLPPSTDFVELSRSRRPPRGPERQRGLWSFLTWPFILAPIAAAEAFVSQHGHTDLTDEQGDSSTRHIHADAPTSQDVLAAGAPTVVNEQPQEDATDASRLVGASRGTFQNGNFQEENHGVPPSGVTETANSGAGGGGGGGGGGSPDAPSETQSPSNETSSLSNDTSQTELAHASGQSLDEISQISQPNTMLSSALDHVEPSIGAVTALGSELPTIVSATSNEISQALPLGTLVSSALDHVEPSIGAVTGALGLELSTIVSATADEISQALPLGTLVSTVLDHVEQSIGSAIGALGSELSTILSATSDEISKLIQPDTLVPALDHVEPSIGTAIGPLGPELSTTVSAISEEISKALPLGTLVSSALDHVEPSMGSATAALGSELSTIVSATSDEISNVIQPDTLLSSALDHVEPSIGAATGALGSELSTIVSATSNEISNVIQPNTLASALDHVEPSIGAATGALDSEPSTIENGTPFGLPAAGEDTPINLKDVLGFDLHVNLSSGAVATEATLAPPGTSLSHSIGDLGFVTTMPSADSISDQPPGISHEVDDLFATGQSASDLQNLGSATSQNQMGLAKAATPATDLGIEGTPADLAARTTSPATPVVQTVGEATDVTPGHSLEFSTPSSSAGDALFQGTNYTDYHMALQTGVSPVVGTPSESAIGTTFETTSVPAITAVPVEQPPVTHADSSAVTQPPQQAAAEHQDLTPIQSLSAHIH
jgi:phage-related protein